MHKNHNRVIALGLGIVTLVWAALASADPSERVARLAYTSGAVGFSPAGDDEWVQATRNRPLITGDHLWADDGARAELQIGSAAIHLDGSTSATLLNLDDSVAQVQLAQGSLNVRVQRLGRDEVFEIDTPNLAFSIREPGDYRIDVDADGNSTTVSVRSGRGEVYGEGPAYTINTRQSYSFYGTDLRDYDRYDSLPQPDDFDRWSNDRNRRSDNSTSARYVSRDVIGYEDLDEYGSWRNDSSYGHVWVPSHVSAGWAPYNEGHWVWVNPWGWTWIDDAPWGFTVSHYGRWANISGGWAWVPGPIEVRPVYAPALVAFVGGSNFQLSISAGNVSGVAWFPLAPREVYRPSYQVSREYFTKINNSNTVVNNVNITNVYNNTNVTNITYVNRQVPGAIVAVPATAFIQSRPVAQARVAVSKETIKAEPVSAVAIVAPVQESVRGAGPQGHKPPAIVMERPVIAKTAPPPKPAPFAAQQSALAANPGKPLDAAALATVKPATPESASPVKVVGPSRAKDVGDKSQTGSSATAQMQTPPAVPPERNGQSEPRKARGKIAEPKTTAPAGVEKAVEPVPAAPKVAEPDRTPAARPPLDRETKEVTPPENGRPEPDQSNQRGQIVDPKNNGAPGMEKLVEPLQAAPKVAEPDRTPVTRPTVKRAIKTAPPSQTARPARPQTPDKVTPVEPVPASPTVAKPDRTPVARPPMTRVTKEEPLPQNGRAERRQPPNKAKPVEPNPATPTVAGPDHAPVAHPPMNSETKETLPLPPRTAGVAPKPDNINGEVQKTKQQLKREEELKQREMQNQGLNK